MKKDKLSLYFDKEFKRIANSIESYDFYSSNYADDNVVEAVKNYLSEKYDDVDFNKRVFSSFIDYISRQLTNIAYNEQFVINLDNELSKFLPYRLNDNVYIDAESSYFVFSDYYLYYKSDDDIYDEEGNSKVDSFVKEFIDKVRRIINRIDGYLYLEDKTVDYVVNEHTDDYIDDEFLEAIELYGGKK